ncbi:hypothetical protein D3C73_1208740 [compost metagenome]
MSGEGLSVLSIQRLMTDAEFHPGSYGKQLPGANQCIVMTKVADAVKLPVIALVTSLITEATCNSSCPTPLSNLVANFWFGFTIWPLYLTATPMSSGSVVAINSDEKAAGAAIRLISIFCVTAVLQRYCSGTVLT